MSNESELFTEHQKKIVKQIKNIFVATDTLQLILDEMKEIRELSKIDEYENLPECIFIGGETGTGKSHFIKQYQREYDRYDLISHLGERTIVPVLYCELPKATHPKPVVSELLDVLGDPLKGLKGDVRQLTSRLVHLLKESKTELLIIDELQHAIEKASNTVIQDIGEWFKILINKSKIPIAFFGEPWATAVFDVNPQLSRRVSKRDFVIPNYTALTFDKFQMFIENLQKKLPIKPAQDLFDDEMAFKLFAASSGNLSNLVKGIIMPASISALKEGADCFTEEHMKLAFKQRKSLSQKANFVIKNPFKKKIDDIEGWQQLTSSHWDNTANTKAERIIHATYSRLKFKDIPANQILSKR
ncbi:TniB family NTP-binding protein [Parashewanella tropica]|uniref:TniB family NTP-binding protein n=1 Tax=Parashewanella tropica TaxID=2547970 RepID=UPI001059489D|nr:TniB family NTP-binding protein [Parashewanella tropica]